MLASPDHQYDAFQRTSSGHQAGPRPLRDRPGMNRLKTADNLPASTDRRPARSRLLVCPAETLQRSPILHTSVNAFALGRALLDPDKHRIRWRLYGSPALIPRLVDADLAWGSLAQSTSTRNFDPGPLENSAQQICQLSAMGKRLRVMEASPCRPDRRTITHRPLAAGPRQAQFSSAHGRPSRPGQLVTAAPLIGRAIIPLPKEGHVDVVPSIQP